MAPAIQAEINADLLTALSDDETPPPVKLWHSRPILRNAREATHQLQLTLRESNWLMKGRHRDHITRAKRTANRTKRREGKTKTLP
jgi:hypothetical protein